VKCRATNPSTFARRSLKYPAPPELPLSSVVCAGVDDETMMATHRFHS